MERVANKYVDPKKLAIVVVGNMGEFGVPLTELGPTTKLDITIPTTSRFQVIRPSAGTR